MKKVDKYMEVYMGTKRKIQNGEYAIGDVLPSGDELAALYNCSKLTVKKGLDILVREGIIVRRRGQGTTVIRLFDSKSLPTLGSTHGLHNTYGEERVSSIVNKFEIILPPEDVAKNLGIKMNEYVYHIVRTRLLDGATYSWEDTYMPLSIIPGITEELLKGSIYNYMQDELGLIMDISQVWISGEPANKDDVELLNIQSSDFIMKIEKVAILDTGDVFEYSQTRHKQDRFVFESFVIHN